MIFQYKAYIPVIDPKAFVHPQATIIGNVVIGPDVYIAAGAVLRGDFGAIVVDPGCNVQENCTIHMFPGVTVQLKTAAHIGHGAIIHGATIEENVLVGMNAVIMDDAVIGAESIVGALSFVKSKTIIPKRSLVVGNPAKIIRTVSDEMLAWKTEGTKIYQQLARDSFMELSPCEPLRKMPDHPPAQKSGFKPWSSNKK